MKRSEIPAQEWEQLEICECDHSKATHGQDGGNCLYRGCKCGQFSWAHYNEEGVKKFLDRH